MVSPKPMHDCLKHSTEYTMPETSWSLDKSERRLDGNRWTIKAVVLLSWRIKTWSLQQIWLLCPGNYALLKVFEAQTGEYNAGKSVVRVLLICSFFICPFQTNISINLLDLGKEVGINVTIVSVNNTKGICNYLNTFFSV